MKKITNRNRLRVKVYKKSTVPKDHKGRFFDTRPKVWTRRRLCARCHIRKCEIPALVAFIISPTGICNHCICWEGDRHCCWCGVSQKGARLASQYEQFIERLKEMGCVKCEECHNYVSVPHAAHPAVNPQPEITIRNQEVIHVPIISTLTPPKPKPTRSAPKPAPARQRRRKPHR